MSGYSEREQEVLEGLDLLLRMDKEREQPSLPDADPRA